MTESDKPLQFSISTLLLFVVVGSVFCWFQMRLEGIPDLSLISCLIFLSAIYAHHKEITADIVWGIASIGWLVSLLHFLYYAYAELRAYGAVNYFYYLHNPKWWSPRYPNTAEMQETIVFSLIVSSLLPSILTLALWNRCRVNLRGGASFGRKWHYCTIGLVIADILLMSVSLIVLLELADWHIGCFPNWPPLD